MNNLGQVVGQCTFTGPARVQGFVFDHGVTTDIGGLGGGISSNSLDLWGFDGVRDIDDAGTAVGSMSSSGIPRAFRWDGAIHDITQPIPPGHGTAQGRACQINSSGQIAGFQRVQAAPSASPTTAVRWFPSGTGLDPIPPLIPVTETRGYGINSAGWVVGVASSPPKPFVWDGVSTTALPTFQPGGSSVENAVDINDSGQIVGWSFDPNRSAVRPCRWDGGTLTDLGTLPGHNHGWAFAVNNSGRIVGASGNSTYYGPCRAFVWESGVMQDLNSLIAPGSGWILNVAYDISDAGFIVGVGDPPGPLIAQGFLLVPLPSPFAGDADGDGDVDQDDLDLVLFNFGASVPPGTNGDVDGDGDVDQDDMDIVLFEFGLP